VNSADSVAEWEGALVGAAGAAASGAGLSSLRAAPVPVAAPAAAAPGVDASCGAGALSTGCGSVGVETAADAELSGGPAAGSWAAATDPIARRSAASVRERAGKDVVIIGSPTAADPM
jgi:hypothetical protein